MLDLLKSFLRKNSSSGVKYNFFEFLTKKIALFINCISICSDDITVLCK